MRKERLAKPEAVKRFRREIKATAALAHANVVMAYDADQSGDVHFFAMEYVDGVTLDHLVGDKGPLPARRRLRVCSPGRPRTPARPRTRTGPP